MKKLLVLVMAFAIVGWSIPKPMESIDNYNVLMVHGAYGAKKGVLIVVIQSALARRIQLFFTLSCPPVILEA